MALSKAVHIYKGKLVGSTIGADSQVDVMPTADETTLGKIVQYIGTTTASYTNGYFYKGVSDGAVDPTYSWEAIPVQDLSNAATKNTTTNELDAKLKANTTAAATLSDAQLRDIYAGTSDMTAGTSALATGAIYICYE